MKHLHKVSVRTKTGVQTYVYHRLSRKRIYSPIGSAAFAAEYERASKGYEATVDIGRKGPNPTRVYFVQACVSGMIKIGKAARPRSRLIELQCGSPERLEIIGTIEDKSGGALETYLHARFAEHRSHGEWFLPHAEILDYIAQNARLQHRTAA